VEKKMPPLEELVRMRVVLRVPGMDSVSASRDGAYKTADGQPLHMDLYAPGAATTLRPAVILVHGGPIPRLGAKNMGVFRSYGEILAASGFAAVAFDHRFLAPARLTDAAADVSDLVAYVRENAEGMGIDRERLGLWAFSGGGPLLSEPLRERPAFLRAIVAFYAALDLREPAPGADSGLPAELRERFSAVHALGEDAHGVPPLLVARAGLDHPWLNGGIERFVQQAVARGASIDFLNHPDGRHGFDILDDDARTKQILRRTLEFLRDQLAP
jgi:acetyl esterase/lipase